MLTLQFFSGQLTGERVQVEKDMLLGREDAGVIIEDSEVSRHHAVLRRSGSDWMIEDLGSRNGTFVNDERITAARMLAEGDVVRLGQTTFSVHQGSAGETVLSAVPGATVISSALPSTGPPPGSPVTREPTVPPPTPPATAPHVAEGVAMGAAPTFSAGGPPRRRPSSVASRQAPAVVITFAIIIATGIALTLYFWAR